MRVKTIDIPTEEALTELVALQHTSEKFKNIVKVEWFIGLLCNFSCTYCAEHVRSGFGSSEKIKRAADLLVQRAGHREIRLLLGGGEPSIHPDIIEIVKHIHERGVFLSMISNGSRSPQLYVEMLKHIRYYTFSIHFEQKYQRTIDTILAVQAKLTELAVKEEVSSRGMQANIMMVPGYFHEARETIALMEKNEIPYIIRRVRPLFGKDNKPILNDRIKDRKVYERSNRHPEIVASDYGYYSHEELQFLESCLFKVDQNTIEYWEDSSGNISRVESNANDISLRKLNRFYGWKCWIGIERLHVYPNGDVYRSTCKQGGRLGNLYEDFEMPSEPVICGKQRCTCSWAINVSKAKTDEYMPLLRIGHA